MIKKLILRRCGVSIGNSGAEANLYLPDPLWPGLFYDQHSKWLNSLCLLVVTYMLGISWDFPSLCVSYFEASTHWETSQGNPVDYRPAAKKLQWYVKKKVTHNTWRMKSGGGEHCLKFQLPRPSKSEFFCIVRVLYLKCCANKCGKNNIRLCQIASKTEKIVPVLAVLHSKVKKLRRF